MSIIQDIAIAMVVNKYKNAELTAELIVKIAKEVEKLRADACELQSKNNIPDDLLPNMVV